MKATAKPIKKGKKLGAVKPLMNKLSPRTLLKEMV
jgi:hypothetical protein